MTLAPINHVAAMVHDAPRIIQWINRGRLVPQSGRYFAAVPWSPSSDRAEFVRDYVALVNRLKAWSEEMNFWIHRMEWSPALSPDYWTNDFKLLIEFSQ